MPTTYAAERDISYGIAFGNVATGAPDFDPATPATAWTALNTIGLPAEATITVNKNANQRRPFRASGFRHSRIVDTTNDVNNVGPTYTIAMPATTESLDLLIATAFQKVTEGAATPFVKDYVYPATYPDFSADAGAFLTLVVDNHVANGSEAVLSAATQKMTISCYPEQNEGRLYVSLDMVGKYHYYDTTYSGTMTYPTSITYWDFNKILAATIGGNAVMLYGFSFTFDTSIAPIPVGGYTAGGRGTQTYAMTFLNTTGSVDVLWDSTVRTIISHESTATDFDQIKISWASADPITTSGDLLIKANAKINSHAFKGQKERIVTLDFDTHESATTEAFELHMANAVDRGAVYTSGFFV